jgi:hypothetical protein
MLLLSSGGCQSGAKHENSNKPIKVIKKLQYRCNRLKDYWEMEKSSGLGSPNSKLDNFPYVETNIVKAGVVWMTNSRIKLFFIELILWPQLNNTSYYIVSHTFLMVKKKERKIY